MCRQNCNMHKTESFLAPYLDSSDSDVDVEDEQEHHCSRCNSNPCKSLGFREEFILNQRITRMIERIKRRLRRKGKHFEIKNFMIRHMIDMKYRSWLQIPSHIPTPACFQELVLSLYPREKTHVSVKLVDARHIDVHPALHEDTNAIIPGFWWQRMPNGNWHLIDEEGDIKEKKEYPENMKPLKEMRVRIV